MIVSSLRQCCVNEDPEQRLLNDREIDLLMVYGANKGIHWLRMIVEKTDTLIRELNVSCIVQDFEHDSAAVGNEAARLVRRSLEYDERLLLHIQGDMSVYKALSDEVEGVFNKVQSHSALESLRKVFLASSLFICSPVSTKQ